MKLNTPTFFAQPITVGQEPFGPILGSFVERAGGVDKVFEGLYGLELLACVVTWCQEGFHISNLF